MKKILVILAVFFIANVLSANDKILGKWRTPENKSVVEMYKCGDAVCGKIVSLKEPTYPESADAVKNGKVKAGDAKVDTENPDASKKTQPILGLVFLKGFKYDASDNEWINGEIYNPEDGKTYVGEIKLEGDNVLKLNGHLKISKWLGKKQTWTRAQ